MCRGKERRTGGRYLCASVDHPLFVCLGNHRFRQSPVFGTSPLPATNRRPKKIFQEACLLKSGVHHKSTSPMRHRFQQPRTLKGQPEASRPSLLQTTNQCQSPITLNDELSSHGRISSLESSILHCSLSLFLFGVIFLVLDSDVGALHEYGTIGLRVQCRAPLLPPQPIHAEGAFEPAPMLGPRPGRRRLACPSRCLFPCRRRDLAARRVRPDQGRRQEAGCCRGVGGVRGRPLDRPWT